MKRVNITGECIQHYADIMGIPVAHGFGEQTMKNPHLVRMVSEIQQMYLEGKKFIQERIFWIMNCTGILSACTSMIHGYWSITKKCG